MAACMASRRYSMTEAKIARFLADGRGAGVGAAYKPWLTVRDISSQGKSVRAVGLKSGRVSHFLSGGERAVFLEIDWAQSVVDVREQFPLDRDETRSIAYAMGIKHPQDSGVDIVMTTDFLVDTVVDGAACRIAISVKPASDLDSERTIEKLELERRYWEARNVAYHIVTERERERTCAKILLWLVEWRSLVGLKVPYPEYWPQRCAAVLAALARRRPREAATVVDFVRELEARHDWTEGDALTAVRHLAANRRLTIDIDRPFDTRGPLGQIMLADPPASHGAAAA